LKNNVECEFLVRFHKREKALPEISLWECNGDSWENHAILRIKEYLSIEFKKHSIENSIIA
jgi:hypothetical protein